MMAKEVAGGHIRDLTFAGGFGWVNVSAGNGGSVDAHATAGNGGNIESLILNAEIGTATIATGIGGQGKSGLSRFG